MFRIYQAYSFCREYSWGNTPRMLEWFVARLLRNCCCETYDLRGCLIVEGTESRCKLVFLTDPGTSREANHVERSGDVSHSIDGGD